MSFILGPRRGQVIHFKMVNADPFFRFGEGVKFYEVGKFKPRKFSRKKEGLEFLIIHKTIFYSIHSQQVIS